MQIYLITPPQIIDEDEFVKQLEEVFSTGLVSVLQLRLKDFHGNAVEDKYILSLGKKIKPICDENEVILIINDNPHIAKELDASGVHLGKGDMKLHKAREILGKDKIIGKSCYNSKHTAFKAGDGGADYIAFGAFFETQTKQAETKADIELLKFFCENSATPIAVIGGINHENVKELTPYKPDFIVVCSAIWNYENGAKQAVQDLAKALEEG